MTVSNASFTDAPDAQGQSHVCMAVFDGVVMHNIDLRVPSFYSEQLNAWIAAGNEPTPYTPPPAPPQTLTFLQFMALFTAAEQAAIVNSSDTQTKLFLLMATGAGNLQLNNSEVIAGVNYLASGPSATPPGPGLITAARAAQVLASQAPPSS